jgi:hypothetical protein
MPIAIACPACGKKYKINEDRFGRKLRCQCGEVFRAPGEKQNLTPVTVTSTTTPAADNTVFLPPPVSQGFDDIPSLAPLDPAPVPANDAPWDSVWSPPTDKTTRGLAPTPTPSQDAAPANVAAAAKTCRPATFVWDKYSIRAIWVMFFAFIGFAAPDNAVQLRAFRHMRPSDVAYGASFAMALAAGMMFYAQRNNRKLAFGVSGAILACIGIGWLLTPARKPAIANVPQVFNQPPVIAERPDPPRPETRERPPEDRPGQDIPGIPPEIAQQLTPEMARFLGKDSNQHDANGPQREGAHRFRFDQLKFHADDVAYTEPLGGSGGGEFANIDSDLRPVIGFRYQIGEWAGRAVLDTLEPIYAGQTINPQTDVVAKEGYAVAGVIVDASQFVQAIQVIFMKLNDGRLETSDSYKSNWIGTPSSESPTTLAGDGQLVVGVYGGKGIVLDSVGLILKKP